MRQCEPFLQNCSSKFPDRVEPGCCQPSPPSEPYVTVSRHTAQAPSKVSLVVIPVPITFGLHDNHRLSIWPKPKGAPSRSIGTSFAFPHKTDSLYFLVTRHLPDVCFLSDRVTFKPVSTPLQSGLRFFRLLTPAPPTVCLTVHLPKRRRYGISMFRIYDITDNLGLLSTPAGHHPCQGS